MSEDPVKKVLLTRKEELTRSITAYSELPECLKTTYERRQMLMNSARLIEIALLIRELGIKDAE